MKKLLTEVFNELVLVFTGKSMDILLPPIVFLVLHNTISLVAALLGSLLLSFIFFVKRIKENETWYYALGGLIGVSVAIALVYISRNAVSFFLPDIIGTSLLVLVTFVSLVIKKPLALWVSHITRGWDIKWFYRNDVKPAYTEVTYFWLLFFIARLSIELYLYTTSTIEEIVFANVILGYPLLIAVLTISYIYGITRLRKMKGPGIDEFMNNSLPPYKGQTKGF